MRILYTLIMISAATSPSYSKDSPSYKETLIFIQEKLNTRTSFDSDSNKGNTKAYVNSFYEYAHCKFERRNFVELHGRSGISDRYFDRFDAGEMDPSSVSNKNGSVEIRTFKNLNVVESWQLLNNSFIDGDSRSSYSASDCDYQKNNESCRKFGHSNYVTLNNILSPNDVNARKVASAMKHLLVICGAKEELF